MIQTCKEMILDLQASVVSIALWSLLVHLMIAIFVPIIRHKLNYFKNYLDRNLDDHSQIYKAVKKDGIGS